MTAGALLLALALAGKRDVVLITLDTTRADRLGCYGRAGAGTPDDSRFLKSIGAILWNDRNDLEGARTAFHQALAIEWDPDERAQLTASIDELTHEIEKRGQK